MAAARFLSSARIARPSIVVSVLKRRLGFSDRELMPCYNSPGLPLSPEAILPLLLPAAPVSFALSKGLFSHMKVNLT